MKSIFFYFLRKQTLTIFSRDLLKANSLAIIPANFPDSGGIFTISTILPDFPIGIVKILYFPDFLTLSPVLRQLTTNFQPKSKIRATLSRQPIRIGINSRHYCLLYSACRKHVDKCNLYGAT